MNITLNFYLIICIIIKNSNGSTVENVRKGIIDYFAKHPNEAYKSDLDVIANKDWLIERFSKGNNDENKVREKLILTLKHWKELNLNDLNDQYFPSEFHATGHLSVFFHSKNNIPLANVYARCMPPWLLLDPQLIDIEMLWFEYLWRNITYNAQEKNWGAVGYLKNIRLDILHPKIWGHLFWLIKLMDERTPSFVIGTDLNEAAEKFMNGFKILLRKETQEKVNFISGSELSKTVSIDQIPAFVGRMNTSYNRMPFGAKSGKCLPQFKHISAKLWEDFKDKNIDCIIEGLAESKILSVDEYLNIGCK